jgi:hypothetical protein
MTPEPVTEPIATLLPPELQPAVTLLVQGIVSRNGAKAALVDVETTIRDMRVAIEMMWPTAAEGNHYDLIAKEALTQISVDIDPPIVLAPKFEPWFDHAVVSGAILLQRWYSYKQYLTHDAGFAPSVVDVLDQASSEVVDLLGDPTQSGLWKRRGLVIGDVQSGKTATYIGIINKAADAGFRLVVLLTGGTESLRRQTQERIDQGFLGKDSRVTQDKVIGVGNHPTQDQFLRGQGMTTHASDFNSASLAGQGVHIDPNADHPYVFVIKKNKVPLTNLITWLSAQFDGEKFDIPMLVVDDESDYASVNTNYRATGDTSPTVINKKIRELLALTTRSSYMAFTATPFANVFIDHTTDDEALQDDLFPHHYIFALASPSNYCGADHYFTDSDQGLAESLMDITDAHEAFPAKHKSHLNVDELPASLEEAVRAFVVASSIRLARGDHGPRSMLVNVSRFKKVQQQVYDLVSEEFAEIKAAIEIHGQQPRTGPETHPVLKHLAEAHADHFPDTPWPLVREKLFAAVYDTTVELINSSRDKSEDDRARNIIAVGGDVLSRGLTVSGLMVSYFYRIVGAADTLLQMARWFGYRPGYEDLVRIWISPDTADQFRYVADVIDELREQIREMRDLGKTPADFGLMVRKHPESLAITAKRGVAESRSMVISLAGRRIETTRLPADPKVQQGNTAAVKDFLKALESDDPDGGWEHSDLGYLGRKDVPRQRIADLIERFRYDRGSLILANALHTVIREQAGPAFQSWTVAIVGGEGEPVVLTPTLTLPHGPTRAVRYAPDSKSGTFRVSGSRARLAGNPDLGRSFRSTGPALPEREAYTHLPHPTLMIYPLQPKLAIAAVGKGEHAEHAAIAEQAAAEEAWHAVQDLGVEHLMALKIAIPGEPGSGGGDVVYLLNGPAIEEYTQDYLIADDDLEDTDE